MKRFKEHWQITSNWQLLFPVLGMILAVYSAFRLANLLFQDQDQALLLITMATMIFSVMVIGISVWVINKLEGRWIVDAKWELIRIFIVFAVTGSSSVFVGRPIMKLMGITKENLNIIVYWVLFIIIGLVFYQLLLVFFGWAFGQFKFFWNFEKKMLKHFGLKRFINE
ncbi:hypothetical protein FJ651_09590 [Paucihalobacter ruber]|uniref:DUF6787 domain-containing protein n=1 Tax=Paucihalobacter ruber TaxID=2567861 RepID=A0A506PID2_9FLAO|nr:DUF6787 family protein [Paucihalobacter ruber]TPV33334.1 hypothetical protein FJ651_09590 [Paucihalobacter ruber]